MYNIAELKAALNEIAAEMDTELSARIQELSSKIEETQMRILGLSEGTSSEQLQSAIGLLGQSKEEAENLVNTFMAVQEQVNGYAEVL